MKCPICGKPLLMYMDTPLCSDCDWKVIWKLRYDRDERLKNENNKSMQ